jgi:hypothetical protein
MAARMWTSFVTDLNPNGHGGEFVLSIDWRPILVYCRPLYQSIILTRGGMQYRTSPSGLAIHPKLQTLFSGFLGMRAMWKLIPIVRRGWSLLIVLHAESGLAGLILAAV